MRPGRVRGDRPVVDDPAAARILVPHHPERGLGAQERPGQVRGDDRLPLGERHVLKRHRRCGPASVVEQHVHAAEVLQRLIEQPLHLAGIADVRDDAQQSGPGGRAVDHGLLQRFPPPAGDHDRVPIPPEGQGRRPANAGAATSNYRDLA